MFRDRRPELYQIISSLDGKTQHSAVASASAASASPSASLSNFPDYSNWKPSKPAATATAGSGVLTRTVPASDAKARQTTKLELSTPKKGLFLLVLCASACAKLTLFLWCGVV